MEAVLRRYTFKLYPNAAQRASLERQCKLHAWLWNAALQERMDCYRLTGKSLSYFDQAKHVKTIRADDPEYAALSADSLALTLKRLDMAFQAFFRRAKAGAGAEAGFPRFRAADRYETIPFRDAPKGWRLAATGGVNWTVYAKGTPGLIRARGKFPAEPEAIRDMTIMRRDGGWWMSVVVRMAPRRAAGGEALRVAFDLIDEFARVERANGECLPAVSLNAGSGNPTVICEPCGEISGVEPQNAVGPQEALASIRRSVAGVEPQNAVGPQAKPAIARVARAGVEPQNAVGPQEVIALRPDGKDPGVEPQNAVGPQGGLLSIDPGDTGVEPQNAIGPQDHVVAFVTQGDERGRISGHAPSGADGKLWKEPAGTEALVDELKSNRDRRFKHGSLRWRREKQRAARLSARQARRQRDYLHRWSTVIIRLAASIEVVAPKIKDATRTARGDARAHGAAVGPVAMLNRSILAHAPATAIQMLEYKAGEAGIPFGRIVPTEHATDIGRDLPEATKAARVTRRILQEDAA